MTSRSELLTPEKAERHLKNLLEQVNQALAPHDAIRSEDHQYEDPQEWWLRPLKRQLEEALFELEQNA